MPRYLLLPLLLAATSLFAQPVITGISPTEGPTSGGTVVTITGSGFSGANLEVKFGLYTARSVERMSDTTLRVVTPGHPPGLAHVFVNTSAGRGGQPDGFRFVSTWREAVERVLMPIFVAYARGAYGSEFRTVCEMWNRGAWDGWVFGAPTGFFHDYEQYFVVGAGWKQRCATNGNPGRFLDIKDAPEEFPMNLRVYDFSRSDTDLGTEIPVVTEREFKERISLVGVPFDPRYRITLRIYGTGSGNSVDVDAGSTRRVVLRDPRGRDEFDPAYAELSFAAADLARPDQQTAAITVTSVARSAGEPKPRIWALITVTNNETQHITTITPQPSR